MRTLLAGLLTTLCLSTTAAADLSQLRQALDAGDTAAMTEAVEALYQSAGISVDDRIVWTLKPYTETFNYFSDMYAEIVLGSMPAAAEVADYWNNWSKTLTGARWQAEDFFADAAEATALARYNQFVLAAHEMAHAVTYRYDPNHFDRHGGSVNCREFYADRLTAALLQDVAEADPQLSALRTRYLALMASMNAAIAANDRYHIESLGQLVDDCESIAVSQPTPETLQPYVSAFFERQRLLLDADLPPLADLAATFLFPRLAETAAGFGYGDESAALELVTLREAPSPETKALSTDDYDAIGGFSLEGELFVARIEHAGRTDTLSFYYGRPDALEAVAVDQIYIRPDTALEMTGLVPLGPDGFLASLIEDSSIAVLLFGIRENGSWTLNPVYEQAGMARSRVVHDEAGRLFFLYSSEASALRVDHGWRAIELTPDPPKEIVYEGILGTPVGMRHGMLLTERWTLLYEFDIASAYNALAGNGLSGSKDGRLASQEFVDITTTQALPDGRIMILDRDPKDRTIFVVRELRPAQ